MMTTSHSFSAWGFLAAVLACLGGIIAFNVIDGIFGFPEAILGVVASIAITVFVVWRSPKDEGATDA
jgi:UDP-N-acetylmuramyl pentapeptide phosphotransferase/UDP-N-acetylglucosamine-1-phosphate transferase